ncbi:MAG: hypothetical protein INQ03_25655 [Candidatus Heimdallarchaeota archaeon]|nr:hypothetical protein [Candidatus Heimdallarchaeota archaeon]
MKHKSYILYSILVLIISIALIMGPVRAQLSGDDFTREAEDLGEVAQVLILIPFIYAAIHYLFKYRKHIMHFLSQRIGWDDETEKKQENAIKLIYRKIRTPLLYFHGLLNLTATIVGAIHGMQMIDESEGSQILTGVILFSAMLLLSISGLLAFIRMQYHVLPRTLSSKLRIVHKQWVYTIIMLITLLLHGD